MKKSTKLILSVTAVFTILVILCGLVMFLIFPSYTANWDTEPVRINIPQGCDYHALRDTLNAHEVVINKAPASLVFDIMARVQGLDKNVRPGSYLVPRNMEMLQFVRKLRNGQQDPIRLTIGKFRTPQQLNEYLGTKLMHNDFNVTLEDFYLIRPNTYEFYWTVTPENFMQRMEKEYRHFSLTPNPSPSGEGSGMQTIAQQADKIAQQYNLLPSPSGEGSGVRLVIILASIVEEETNNNAEKPLIASVYLNRLKKGIPLQADPTVKYAVGDFTLRRILNKHLAVESPFNTYLHTGLPPAPICLPSESSVDAVLNAPETNYNYFCASDKMDGTHRFAATLAEHNRNAAAFHKALNQRGIR